MMFSRAVSTALVVLLGSICSSNGFHTSAAVVSQCQHGQCRMQYPVNNNNNRRRSPTSLFNVPPPESEVDSVSIKDAADRAKPPQSFYELQINSVKATNLALEDGERLIEIEVRITNHLFFTHNKCTKDYFKK